jgi:hypothetical protein
MNEAVMRMLVRYERRKIEDDVKALREIQQEIALLGLWRGLFLKKLHSTAERLSAFSMAWTASLRTSIFSVMLLDESF